MIGLTPERKELHQIKLHFVALSKNWFYIFSFQFSLRNKADDDIIQFNLRRFAYKLGLSFWLEAFHQYFYKNFFDCNHSHYLLFFYDWNNVLCYLKTWTIFATATPFCWALLWLPKMVTLLDFARLGFPDERISTARQQPLTFRSRAHFSERSSLQNWVKNRLAR